MANTISICSQLKEYKWYLLWGNLRQNLADGPHQVFYSIAQIFSDSKLLLIYPFPSFSSSPLPFHELFPEEAAVVHSKTSATVVNGIAYLRREWPKA